jgi:hypothetical protein
MIHVLRARSHLSRNNNGRALPVALFYQCITWRFYLPLVYWWVPWPLQVYCSTIPRLKFKQRAVKSATCLRSRWCALRHMHPGPGNVKSWSCSTVQTWTKAFTTVPACFCRAYVLVPAVAVTALHPGLLQHSFTTSQWTGKGVVPGEPHRHVHLSAYPRLRNSHTNFGVWTGIIAIRHGVSLSKYWHFTFHFRPCVDCSNFPLSVKLTSPQSQHINDIAAGGRAYDTCYRNIKFLPFTYKRAWSMKVHHSGMYSHLSDWYKYFLHDPT